METSRRSFLKLGLIGAVVLAAGGTVYRALQPPAPRRFTLDGDASAVLTAVLPVMLGPVFPADPAARAAAIAATVERVNNAILGLPLSAQKEVQDLFGLLALAPGRRLLAGVSGSWAEAAPQQIEAFLNSWRGHRYSMLQTAYLALHDLMAGAWYSDPAHWAAIGYPGPIKELG
jgi:hypothetical protein